MTPPRNVVLGRIHALYRYPVKSMAGETLSQVDLGWHGLDGDRRFAVRRVADQTGFPWLTASKLAELILFRPVRVGQATMVPHPTHVETPEGARYPLYSDELRGDIARRYGAEVQLMQLKHGIFDEAPISLLNLATSQRITDEAGQPFDVRRFRPNILLETHATEPFAEDAWVGKTIVFGEAEDGPAVSVTLRDERCVMVNLHPDTAHSDPAVLKAAVKLNGNCAGVYATVVRTGTLAVGQNVYLRGAG